MRQSQGGAGDQARAARRTSRGAGRAAQQGSRVWRQNRALFGLYAYTHPTWGARRRDQRMEFARALARGEFDSGGGPSRPQTRCADLAGAAPAMSDLAILQSFRVQISFYIKGIGQLPRGLMRFRRKQIIGPVRGCPFVFPGTGITRVTGKSNWCLPPGQERQVPLRQSR